MLYLVYFKRDNKEVLYTHCHSKEELPRALKSWEISRAGFGSCGDPIIWEVPEVLFDWQVPGRLLTTHEMEEAGIRVHKPK